MLSIDTATLLALAHEWETRALTGSGFELELDTTWLTAARELRELVGVAALLGFMARCA